MAKSDRSRAAEQSRRQQANQLNPAAHAYYRDHWDDVRNIADVEDVAGEWDHRAEERTALQLLEYAGIDVLVDTHKTQVAIQEKFVVPTTNGDSLLIRMDNGSSSVWSEAQKLFHALDPDTPPILCPSYFGFGKAESWSEFEWFLLIDVAAFVEQWDAGKITPSRGVYRNQQDGTESLMFAPADLDVPGVILESWGWDRGGSE